MTYHVQFEGHRLTIHEREMWQDPNVPVIGPSFEWDTDTQAVHYTAAVDLPDGDPDEIPPPGMPEWHFVFQYIRRIQADYAKNRGYSIGYNWVIDYLGGISEARGWDFECAANSGWNSHTWAVLLLVDGNDPANELMLRSARYLNWQAEQLSGHTHLIRPHSQLHPDGRVLPFPGNVTGCPGVGVRSQLNVPGFQGGKFNWRSYTPSVPTTPTEGEKEMFTLVCKGTDAAHHPVIITICGNKVGMTGLTSTGDENAIAKANGQDSVVVISNSLWEDWLQKALAS